MSELLRCARDDFETASMKTIRGLQYDTEFVDVTLASQDEEQIKAHKVILCSASPFFRRIISKNPHQHPILFLRNVSMKILKSILSFIYQGYAEVHKQDLETFLTIAGDLEVEGLAVDQYDKTQTMDEDDSLSNIVEENPTCDVFTIDEVSSKYDGGKRTNIYIKENKIEISNINQSNKLETEFCEIDVDTRITDTKHENKTGDALVEVGYKTSRSESWPIAHDESSDNDSPFERRYECVSCDYKAKSRSKLKIHDDAIHKGTRYPCNQCGYKATQKSSLNRHAKQHL